MKSGCLPSQPKHLAASPARSSMGDMTNPTKKHNYCSYCPSTPTHWSLSVDNQIIYACVNHQHKLLQDSPQYAGIFPVGSIRERAIRSGLHPEIKA